MNYASHVIVNDEIYLTGKRVDKGHSADVGAFQWIGVHDPGIDELLKYQERFAFNDLALEDALSGKQRPKLDVYENQVLIVLKTVSYDDETKHIIVGDLTLFVGSQFILTVRHGDALPLRSARADLELHPEKLQGGPTAVVHEIIDRLVDQYVDVAAKLAEDVEEIEDDFSKWQGIANFNAIFRDVIHSLHNTAALLAELHDGADVFRWGKDGALNYRLFNVIDLAIWKF